MVAYREGAAITAGGFLADVRHMASRLPAGRHVLNLCADRYHFAVGLAACLVSRKISLMPGTQSPEALRQIAASMPGAFCLIDGGPVDVDLERVQFERNPAGRAARPAVSTVPQIDAGQTAAILYTSGSTGAPVPHAKTWGRLVRCIRNGATVLGLDDRPHAIIGTVPAQHMYGFESTVLLPLLSGGSFCAARPFYPADVCAAIAAAPRPRALVSTPIHLRALAGAGMALPPVDLIVSATAPLSQPLAAEVEARFAAPLLEIYGSTETGQIAARRTKDTDLWRLWPGVRLEMRDGVAIAEGGHVERRTALADVIEISGSGVFRLYGRSADLVNIAGKRSSFGYLNHQLNAIPGVVDGVFFQRAAAAADNGVARLAAAVVAPTLSAAALAEQLRLRIDPVFMPRPLILVERLPRNETGKLPQQSLRALLDRPGGAADAT